jgi:GT2 family glycosyltransferase
VKRIELFILAYNNSKLIKELLVHIENSNILKLPIDVHVVDNGSSDDTEQVVGEYYFANYHKISKNAYFTGGANYCLRLSNAEHVFFMNSDVIPEDTTFIEIIKLVESDERLGLVGCKSRLPNGELQDIVKSFPSLLEIHALHGFITGLSILKQLILKNYSRKSIESSFGYVVDVVQDSFVYIRGSLISHGLRYDETMKLYYTEDYICEEVRRRHYKVGFCNNAEVMHYSGATADQKNKSIRKIYDQDAVVYSLQKYGLISSSLLRFDIFLKNILIKMRRASIFSCSN